MLTRIFPANSLLANMSCTCNNFIMAFPKLKWIFTLLIIYFALGHTVIRANTLKKDGSMEPMDSSHLTDDDDDDLEYVAPSQESWPSQLQDSQLDGPNGNEGEWSPWSEWSSCSRTCDGGVSSQTRRCDTRHGCRGESIRHRICNMQPCPEPTDFRVQQCSAFKNVKYHGENYEWEPHYDPQDPCSLTCRAKGQNIVAQLFPKVRDGTRCREGSLDMCINGKCQPVGCDLQLGSTKKVDACGVCGGNGSSCGHPSFYWQETAMSNCSATCGGGLQMSKPVCKNKGTGREVDERLCDVTTRPAPNTKKCNVEKCPATWITEDWAPCPVTCGGGFHQRLVYCGDTLANGTNLRVEESRCFSKKPKFIRPCNPEECPRWYETYWSGCSVTCGQGHQTRKVICRDFRGHITDTCDPAMKPTDKQPCTTGLPCAPKVKVEDLDKASPEIHSPLVQPYPPLQAQHITGTDIVSSEPRYAPDPWSACSVSCGEGIKKRRVHCKIFLEFSRTEAVLPDKECPGKRPSETERCVARPCSLNRLGSEPQPNALEINASGDEGKEGVVVTYSWRQIGFTPCSATCLGGVRESIVQCVRDHDQAAVSPFLCDVSKKPDVITQTCNDQPCLPRWNITEFSKCTKTCGGGIQTRQVQCVHDVTRGNTLVIPNNFCNQPMPRTDHTCGLLDCRPQWVTSPWTKCSRSCGSGTKTRKIECKQLLAIGQHMIRPPSKCPARRPHVTKKCNTKACTDANLPEINYINQSYVQSSPTLKKISLKVGGKATVFKGTRLKIKCPVKKYDRARILWVKDHTYLESSKRFRISRKGTLKIRSVQYSDSGVYNCVAGGSKANITIEVKPKPVPFGSSEEDRTVERPGNSIEHFTPPIRPNPNAPARRPPKLHTIEDEDDEDDMTPDVVEPKEEFSHEHTVNNAWPPIPNNPPVRARPKTKTYSEEKPNSLEANIKGFDTWELQHGSDGGTFNDQNSGMESDLRKPSLDDPQLYLKSFRTSVVPIANAGSVRAGDEPDRSHSASAPHLQRVLEKFQHTLGTPRGLQLGNSPHFSGDEADEEMPFADGQIGILANSFVLGKGKAENIKFDWMVANWSTCSETCGGNGVQIRAAQCMVRLHNVSITVDNSLCESAGLDAPPSFQKCGIPECPIWETGPYSACNESRCFGLNTSVQRRNVRCLLRNGTVLNPNNCDNNTRPREKRECYNVMCRGTWKVGPWSDCNAECDQVGIKSRILRCVWYGTQRAAGVACHDKPRPSVLEKCQGQSCSNMAKCTDLSKYCSLANKFNMCQMPRYNSQCCKSCRGRAS